MSGKRWCFTVNNYTEDEIESVRSLPAKYHVFGYETGESGTPHLQGFAVFAEMKRMAAMKKLLPRAHLELAKGSSLQASDYCKKDGKFEEFGVPPAENAVKAGGEATKNLFKRTWEQAKAGDVEEIDPRIRLVHYKTIRMIGRDYLRRPPDVDDVTGLWLYGAPGVGKSRVVSEVFPEAYRKLQNKWWDGYQNEEIVWLDDFDMKELGHHLKIWADRYAFLAEIKGSAMYVRPRLFVVTSNYKITDPFFCWDDVTTDAIDRRFKTVHVHGYHGLSDRIRAIRVPEPVPLHFDPTGA